eukprot:SAG11_NODE_258_length_11542_cov_35.970899_1_plen_132_part_00
MVGADDEEDDASTGEGDTPVEDAHQQGAGTNTEALGEFWRRVGFDGSRAEIMADGQLDPQYLAKARENTPKPRKLHWRQEADDFANDQFVDPADCEPEGPIPGLRPEFWHHLDEAVHPSLPKRLRSTDPYI